MDADLAVVGAGPAGLACAIRAADLGLSVLLCDAAPAAFRAARPADKPCGEGVMPGGAEALRRLGVDLRESRPFPGVDYFLGGAEALRLDFERPGAALWRPDLQRALLAAARARSGIRERVGRALCEHLPEGGFRLATAAGSLRARWLVAADGGSAAAAPWLRVSGRRRPARGLGRVGARARFAERGALDRVEVHFGGGIEVYLTPLPRGAVNVVVLADDARGASATELVARGLAAHPSAARRLGAPLTRAEARPLAAAAPRVASDGDSFLAGDSAGRVDPILGAGVAIAVRTGIAAAECAHLRSIGADPREAARAFERRRRRERATRARLAGLLQAAARHPALARGMAAALRAMPAVRARLGRIATGWNEGGARLAEPEAR